MPPPLQELIQLNPRLANRSEEEIGALIQEMEDCGYSWNSRHRVFHNPELELSIRTQGLDLFTPEEFRAHHQKHLREAATREQAQHSPKTKAGGLFKRLLRWVLLLPAAMLAFILSGAVVRLLSYFELTSSTVFSRWINEATASAVSGVAFAYAAWTVAPSHKDRTIKVLGLIFGALMAISAIRDPETAVWSAVALASGALTAALLRNRNSS